MRKIKGNNQKSNKDQNTSSKIWSPQVAKDDMQAPEENSRRDASRASHDTALQHPAHRRRNMNGKRAASKVGPEGSPYVQRGGQRKSANSKDWKSPREIYDPDLGRHKTPVVTAPDLMEQIVTEENILKAVRKVNSEPRKAVGVDRKTVRQVCTPVLNFPEARIELARQLLQGEYRPGIVRTVYIPKPNGKERRIGIAIVRDRIVQRMILQAVEANMPDNARSGSSFAYHHGTGVADATVEADKIIGNGFQAAVCVDLKGFFDNVPHERLRRKLYAHVVDKRVCRLVWWFVTALVSDKGQLSRNRLGTPQGSVISPWLASDLYLDELDRELEERNHPFVRYADDVVIFCQTMKAAKRVKMRIMDFIENTMRCPVNRDKTKVVPTKSMPLLGLYRKGGRWYIERKKVRKACGEFLTLLQKDGKGNRGKAIRKFKGVLNHYRRIPNLAESEIPSLQRWMERKLPETLWKALRTPTRMIESHSEKVS